MPVAVGKATSRLSNRKFLERLEGGGEGRRGASDARKLPTNVVLQTSNRHIRTAIIQCTGTRRNVFWFPPIFLFTPRSIRISVVEKRVVGEFCARGLCVDIEVDSSSMTKMYLAQRRQWRRFALFIVGSRELDTLYTSK